MNNLFLVFDVDGTLLHSEEVKLRAFERSVYPVWCKFGGHLRRTVKPTGESRVRTSFATSASTFSRRKTWTRRSSTSWWSTNKHLLWLYQMLRWCLASDRLATDPVSQSGDLCRTD